MVSSELHPEAATAPSPRTPLATTIHLDLDMDSPAGSPSRARAHARSHSWCAPTAEEKDAARAKDAMSSEMVSMEFVDSFDIVKTPLRRVPKKRPTTRGKKRTADDTPVSRQGRSSRSRSKSISPRHSMEVLRDTDARQDSSMSLESEYLATPAPPTTELKRRIAPLRSSRSSLFGIGSTPMPSPIQVYAYRDKAPSRDSSPVPGARNDSSPLKKPRTSLSGEIINFHYSSDSDSDSDTTSPTIRSRARFNQLLGPSPLQKSFSSTSPPTPCGSLHKSVSASMVPIRPPRTPLSAASAQALGVPFDRSISTPTIPTSGSLQIPSGVLTPNGELLSPLKARSKLLSEVEGLETELNKVFALVHGKGLGLGAGGRGRRTGSGLRQSKGMDDAEDRMVDDGSPAPRRRSDGGRRGDEDMEIDAGQ